MEHFINYITHFLIHYPLIAPIVFVGLHTIMAVFFIPCSPMTLMAGALWGQTYGLLISMIAAVMSSATTFLLSRSFLRERIERFLEIRYPKVAMLLSQTAIHDWKIIAISQMNPMIPASTMGYMFGLCRISFLRYVLLSGLFFIPLQVLFVMTGYSVINLFDSKRKLGFSIIAIILMIIFVLMNKFIYKKLCQIFGIKDGT